MTTKRRVLLVALLVGTALALESQAQKSDLIAMLDTSESVFGHFDSMVDYLITDILVHKLRIDDTFHLLSFDEYQQAEMVATIRDQTAVEAAVASILLLQPLGLHTDLLGAVEFLLEYASENARGQLITAVLLTDGVHDPPPGSRTPQPDLRNLLPAETVVDARLGWNAYVFQIGTAQPSGFESEPRSDVGLAEEGERAIARHEQDTRHEQIASEEQDAPQVSLPRGDIRTETLRLEPESAVRALSSEQQTTIGEPTPSSQIALQQDQSSFNLPAEYPPQTDTSLVDTPADHYLPSAPATVQAAPAQAPDPRTSVLRTQDKRFEFVPADTALADVRPPNGQAVGSPDGSAQSEHTSTRHLPADAVRSDSWRIDGQADSPPQNAGRTDSIPKASTLTSSLTAESSELHATEPKAETVSARLVPAEMETDAAATTMKLATKELATEAVATETVGTTKVSDPAPTTPAVARAVEANETEPARTEVRSAVADTSASSERRTRQPISVLSVLRSFLESRAARVLLYILIGLAAAAGLFALTRLALRLRERLREQDLLRPRRAGERDDYVRPLQLRVSGQNPHIGMRNIHRVKPGASASVGSGRAKFLVFVEPVGPRIAEIRNEDRRYVFHVRKQSYFPQVLGDVRDCIGVDIPLVSDRGRRLTLRFSEYVSPLEEINRLMHSIDRAGY